MLEVRTKVLPTLRITTTSGGRIILLLQEGPTAKLGTRGSPKCKFCVGGDREVRQSKIIDTHRNKHGRTEGKK